MDERRRSLEPGAPELPPEVRHVVVALNGELTRLQVVANQNPDWPRRVRLMELRVEASDALSTLVREAQRGGADLARATNEALSVLGRTRTEG